MELELLPGIRQGMFFDLEKTITADAVEQVASLAMWRAGNVSSSQVMRVLWCYLRYNLGLIDGFETLKAEGAQVFAGRAPEEDIDLLQGLYEQRLKHAIYPEARRLIQAGHEMGMHIAIISSTYRFMVAPFARELEIEDFFGCELEEQGGLCTGRLQGAIYHQQMKAKCVHDLSQRHGLSLEHSYAFGDSRNDVPMLEAVGHPVVINPGRKLLRQAEEKTWTIEHWSQRAS